MSTINPLPRFVSFCLVLWLTELDQGWPCDHGSRTVCIGSSDSSVKLMGGDAERMQELESRGVAECHLLGSTEPLYPWTQNYSTQNKIMIYSKLEHNNSHFLDIGSYRCFGLRFQLRDCKLYLMEHASVFFLIDSAILIISFYRGILEWCLEIPYSMFSR